VQRCGGDAQDGGRVPRHPPRPQGGTEDTDDDAGLAGEQRVAQDEQDECLHHRLAAHRHPLTADDGTGHRARQVVSSPRR